MQKRDDFSILDFYATILALAGWIVILASLVVAIFLFSSGTALAALGALSATASGIALLAAAKLLRCVLVIHRDTRALLERTTAGPAPAPAAQ